MSSHATDLSVYAKSSSSSRVLGRNDFSENFWPYWPRPKGGPVALYDIRPGNGAGLFLQPRSPHGAPNAQQHSHQLKGLLQKSINQSINALFQEQSHNRDRQKIYHNRPMLTQMSMMIKPVFGSERLKSSVIAVKMGHNEKFMANREVSLSAGILPAVRQV